jgi:hypothetical protein
LADLAAVPREIFFIPSRYYWYEGGDLTTETFLRVLSGGEVADMPRKLKEPLPREKALASGQAEEAR